ncbi:MAG: cysteine--tRNA ligase [Ignavibacteriales bacterium]|nr:cysteine--tRNA ligase [Ignavibacteriales bacterium]
MGLKVYNTLTRQKEEFKPLREGFVGIYVCGPTVYSHSHIGHGKSYVSFDVIVRYLRYLGYKVLYVQNITDVGHLLDDGEDRILKQSKVDRVHPMQLAETYTQSYFEDMDRLGVARADISPRATGHITEQVELTRRLVEKGYAYEANGSVYFDVRKFADYGKLSGRNLDDMMEGTRVEARSEKRHPADFALWKKAEPEHIMQWPSPWGQGFPGWHVECSAMSMKYLGESFDIHGGGLDNQFPHHECEIAQSVSATDKPFVKYWMHNNLVTVAGQKMSKSLGNFVTLKDAFRKYDPLVIRFFILQSHYRSTLDFSEDALNGAKAGLEKLVNTMRNLQAELTKADAEKRAETQEVELATYRERFRDAMDDDFNTPQAIAVLFDLAKEINQALNSYKKLSGAELRSVASFLSEAGSTILGIFSEKPDVAVSADGNIQVELIQLLVDLRNEVRKQKLWALSDLIREGLKKAGIAIEDKKDGTFWKKIT